MDRDELQDRIRARRSGGEPYRRGTVDDERGGYERFVPDPIDEQARRASTGAQPRRDYFEEEPVEPEDATAPAMRRGALTRDRDEWARPAAAAAPAIAPPPPAEPYAPPPSDVPVGEADPAGSPEYVDNLDDDSSYGEADYPYPYQDWEERRERRPGAGALAILGFLALGVLALLGGAALAGIFDDDGAGVADATASASATVAPTVAATASPTAAASASAGAEESPSASGEPVVFPDGFTAEAEPCIRGSAGPTGCNANGASNAGSVDIWVGFTNGNSEDVIGATLVAPDGSEVDGSIDLAGLGCTSSCNGYTWFPFEASEPGTYEVRVTRNGELAAITTFEVS